MVSRFNWENSFFFFKVPYKIILLNATTYLESRFIMEVKSHLRFLASMIPKTLLGASLSNGIGGEILKFGTFGSKWLLQILMLSLKYSCHLSPLHKISFLFWMLFHAQELSFLALERRKSPSGKYKYLRRRVQRGFRFLWILQACLSNMPILNSWRSLKPTPIFRISPKFIPAHPRNFLFNLITTLPKFSLSHIDLITRFFMDKKVRHGKRENDRDHRFGKNLLASLIEKFRFPHMNSIIGSFPNERK